MNERAFVRFGIAGVRNLLGNCAWQLVIFANGYGAYTERGKIVRIGNSKHSARVGISCPVCAPRGWNCSHVGLAPHTSLLYRVANDASVPVDSNSPSVHDGA